MLKAVYLALLISGNSSVVEHHLAKVRVAGSNPVSRSFKKSSKIFLWAFFIYTPLIMHFTYILYSPSKNRYYTGHTSNKPTQRLDQHNNGMTVSTKSGVPWSLRFYCSFNSKTEAIQFENLIKKQKSRVFIEKLIQIPVPAGTAQSSPVL